MKYPGSIIKKGSTNKKAVTAIQKRLSELSLGDFGDSGVFGPKTVQSVKTFQARFGDHDGNPLVIDGEVGSITWEALFGATNVPVAEEAKTQGIAAVIAEAVTQIGVMEDPPGSNSGPKVKEYLASVDIDFPVAWCAAFLYWCFDQVAKTKGKPNPLVKTGGVLKHWNSSSAKKILAKDAKDNPALVKPGHIFILDFGGGAGHTGIVESVNGGFIEVIEGNTNVNGSREGVGVFRRTRKINSINKGFLEYKI
jgi:hypothetical protein